MKRSKRILINIKVQERNMREIWEMNKKISSRQKREIGRRKIITQNNKEIQKFRNSELHFYYVCFLLSISN